jgi:membrane protein YqaA with SNARE-associated domain
MLLTLLLGGMAALGDLFVALAGLTIIPIILLVGLMWSERIGRQFDRELDEQQVRKAQQARFLRWVLLLVWLGGSVALWRFIL